MVVLCNNRRDSQLVTPTGGLLSGRVIWLMGPTSSGKTTIAEYCVQQWREQGWAVIHYDGDEVRDFFGDTHGFAEKDRLQVVSTLVKLANKAAAAGVLCIVSALTAHSDAREYVRSAIPSLLLGYICCSIGECARRDPKGLYTMAKKGQVTTLIGWNEPYEPPENPDIILDTETLNPHQSFVQIDTLVRRSDR